MGDIEARPAAVDLSPKTLAAYGPDADRDSDRDVGWELYDLRSDFSQARNVAVEHPDTVKELQDLWWSEAERNRVLPLMAGSRSSSASCRRSP